MQGNFWADRSSRKCILKVKDCYSSFEFFVVLEFSSGQNVSRFSSVQAAHIS